MAYNAHPMNTTTVTWLAEAVEDTLTTKGTSVLPLSESVEERLQVNNYKVITKPTLTLEDASSFIQRMKFLGSLLDFLAAPKTSYTHLIIQANEQGLGKDIQAGLIAVFPLTETGENQARLLHSELPFSYLKRTERGKTEELSRQHDNWSDITARPVAPMSVKVIQPDGTEMEYRTLPSPSAILASAFLAHPETDPDCPFRQVVQWEHDRVELAGADGRKFICEPTG